jgi:hypothetical protein
MEPSKGRKDVGTMRNFLPRKLSPLALVATALLTLMVVALGPATGAQTASAGGVAGQVLDAAAKKGAGSVNWPSFRFDTALSGYNVSEKVISSSNVSGLTTAWTESVTGAVQVAPAVVDGVLYVAASNGFYALSATNGAVLWSHPGFFGRSSPAVSDGVVYVTGEDGNLDAFNTTVNSTNCSGSPVTCNPVWTAAVGGAGTIAQSSPTVSGSMVYVAAGYDFFAFNTAGCAAAVCLPAWKAAHNPANGESPVSGGSTPAVVGSVVYVGGFGGLYAYSAAGCGAATCSELWHGNASSGADTNSVTSSSPAVVGGVAFIGAGNNLDAFSTGCSGTCQPLWSFSTGAEVDSSPAVANGRVYIGSAGKLYAVSTSGSLLWTATTAVGDTSSPVVANGVVYIGAVHNLLAFSGAGTIRCSGSPVTCSPLWSAHITDSSFASPVVVNGVVYQGQGINGLYLTAFKR